MAQIIELSGVRAGSIYRFFPDKTAIAAGVVERHRMAMAPLAASLRPARTLEDVIALIDIIVDMAADHRMENAGFRAIVEAFGVLDRRLPLHDIRVEQVDLVSSLVFDFAPHISQAEHRRVVSYMSELVDGVLKAHHLEDDYEGRKRELKRILRAYLVEVIGEPTPNSTQ